MFRRTSSVMLNKAQSPFHKCLLWVRRVLRLVTWPVEISLLWEEEQCWWTSGIVAVNQTENVLWWNETLQQTEFVHHCNHHHCLLIWTSALSHFRIDQNVVSAYKVGRGKYSFWCSTDHIQFVLHREEFRRKSRQESRQEFRKKFRREFNTRVQVSIKARAQLENSWKREIASDVLSWIVRYTPTFWIFTQPISWSI